MTDRSTPPGLGPTVTVTKVKEIDEAVMKANGT